MTNLSCRRSSLLRKTVSPPIVHVKLVLHSPREPHTVTRAKLDTSVCRHTMAKPHSVLFAANNCRGKLLFLRSKLSRFKT